MVNIIHIVGASGSGTSTLGQALEREYGYKWLDTDGYFWEKTDPPFIKPLPHEERIKLMDAAMGKNPKCVVSGSLCGWGDVFIPRFDLIVFVDTPTDVRIERLQKREAQRFGNRICEDGDMHEEHKKFIAWAASYDSGGIDMRSRALHEKWLAGCSCPVICVDGTKPIDALLVQINTFASLAVESPEDHRARIYPVILRDYNPEWAQWFTDERANLERLIGAEHIARIHHYGSTSVPGLTAKPTVDILLEIPENADIAALKAALPSSEYICLDEDKLTVPAPPPHLMFIKGYLPDGFAERVYHIHVVYPGNHDELRFRDYLKTHPEAVAEYAELKRILQRDYTHDRDGYTEAKTEFIRKIVEKSRKEEAI